MAVGKKIRKDFPIFSRKIHGKRLAYLDNAATTQKPKSVLKAMDDYYSKHNANTTRSVHTLAEEATDAYEKARARIARFIGAKPEQIVFTKNTTEALNLLSYSLESTLSSDRARPILLTRMEHHSNFVPWQRLAMRSGHGLRFLDADPHKPLTADTLLSLPTSTRPALFPFAHASNVLGTIHSAAALSAHAHAHFGCPTVLDAAQSVPHLKIDARKLGADFIAFSGHKMLGPAGIGVLYMAEKWMDKLPPFLTGGGQIAAVSDTTSIWASGPAKFEAGTPDVASAVGLAAAMDFLDKIGMDSILAHEHKLLKRTLDSLIEMDGVKVYGPHLIHERVGVVSFTVDGIHAHDVGTILDRHGVATRSGHHCAQPLMKMLGVPATSRASFYLYNDVDDVDALVDGLKDVLRIFKR